MKRLLLLATLAACGPKPAATPPSHVESGNGWRPLGDGEWQFTQVRPDETSQIALNAAPGGYGLERIDLPTGAREAGVVGLEVSYDTPGEGTWSIVAAGADGMPSGAPVASTDVQIAEKDVHVYVPLAFPNPPKVHGSFWVRFESPDGMLAVGALNEDRGGHVYYQPPGETAQPAPFTPLVHVSLTAVR